jgi:hypothetical protein
LRGEPLTGSALARYSKTKSRLAQMTRLMELVDILRPYAGRGKSIEPSSARVSRSSPLRPEANAWLVFRRFLVTVLIKLNGVDTSWDSIAGRWRPRAAPDRHRKYANGLGRQMHRALERWPGLKRSPDELVGMVKQAGRWLRHPKIERCCGFGEHVVGNGRAVVEHKRAVATGVKARDDDVLRRCGALRPSPTPLVAVVLEQTNMRAAGQVIDSPRDARADEGEGKDRDAPIDSVLGLRRCVSRGDGRRVEGRRRGCGIRRPARRLLPCAVTRVSPGAWDSQRAARASSTFLFVSQHRF